MTITKAILRSELAPLVKAAGMLSDSDVRAISAADRVGSRKKKIAFRAAIELAEDVGIDMDVRRYIARASSRAKAVEVDGVLAGVAYAVALRDHGLAAEHYAILTRAWAVVGTSVVGIALVRDDCTMGDPKRYLSAGEFAERIGVKRDTLNRYVLPGPDAFVGQIRGWLPETVDEWNAARPGRGRWKSTRKPTSEA